MRPRKRAVTVRTASLEMLNIVGAVSRAGPARDFEEKKAFIVRLKNCLCTNTSSNK